MRAVVLFLLILLLPSLTVRAAPVRCAVCQMPAGPRYFAVTSPVLAETQSLCQACAKLPDTCAICRLPVRATDRPLADGRRMCERDARAGVFAEAEVRRVYEEVRRELAGILDGFGVWPDSNIDEVRLVDAREMKRLHESLPSLHDDGAPLGLTVTETSRERKFRHRIHLISGLDRARLAAVCAHEYTHAWLHENLPANRRLDRDTVEGFCELVAYKLMVKRRDELQKRIILGNAYSRGQVNAFVAAEALHHFRRVVNWMKTGVDEALPGQNPGRVLVAQDSLGPGLAPLGWPPPAAVRTPVPSTLRLKGISGSAARRFALINDATLTRNEQGRVRVGDSNVVVRCLDIRERSVLLQVHGSERPVELFLAGKE